jgi:hypothetical protein
MIQRKIQAMFAGYCFFLLLILNGSCNFVQEEYGENYPTFIDAGLTLRFNTGFNNATLPQKYIGTPDAGYNIRYIIEIYDAATKERKERLDFTQSESLSGEKLYTTHIKLAPIKYYLLAWVDIVPANTSIADYHYYTQEGLELVRIADISNYKGSLNTRDAFCGRTDMDLIAYDGQFDAHTEVTIDLERPFGIYTVVASDLQAYIANNADKTYEEIKPAKVRIRYNVTWNPYFRDGYDVNRRVANHFEENMAPFESNLVSRQEDKEIILAFDYIFVTQDNAPLSFAMDIIDASGQLITTKTLSAPLERNRQTVIADDFLTKKGAGGISINDGFDGDDLIIKIP